MRQRARTMRLPTTGSALRFTHQGKQRSRINGTEIRRSNGPIHLADCEAEYLRIGRDVNKKESLSQFFNHLLRNPNKSTNVWLGVVAVGLASWLEM